ncbi:hypothetical protein HanPSC8_Chr15g0682031 [Helianthus annuus]|nr:hypothetical protein HanPSC8_Chr15g0682031 [Helianthus annuus]
MQQIRSHYSLLNKGEQILEVSRADMEPTIMGYEIGSGGLRTKNST